MSKEGANGTEFTMIGFVFTGAELPTVFLAITDIVYVNPIVNPCEMVKEYVLGDVYFTSVFEYVAPPSDEYQ
jgi:hypothetical protein